MSSGKSEGPVVDLSSFRRFQSTVFQFNEDLLRKELDEVVSRVRGLMGDGIHTMLHMEKYFLTSVVNILWSRFEGKRYRHDALELLGIIDDVKTLAWPELRHSFFYMLKNCFWNPLAAYLPGSAPVEPSQSEKLVKRCKSVMKNRKELESISDIVDEEAGESPLDVYLSSLVIGSQVFNNVLEFTILYLILHPDKQELVYKEIANKRKQIDKPFGTVILQETELPYTMAFIYEVYRIGSVLPLSGQVEVEVDGSGNLVPTGETRIDNQPPISAWRHPKEFKPERFLNDQGTINQTLADRVANPAHLFLLVNYVSNLVHKFKWMTVPGHLDPCRKPQDERFARGPKPFNVISNLRF